MWRGEAADPRLRANVTLLELLDRAPDWERLRGRARVGVADGARGCASGWSSPRSASARRTWVTVGRPRPGPAPAAAAAGRARVDAPAARRRAGVRRRARSTATGRCGGRCWSRGSRTARAGYVVKTHHSVTDGLGAVQLMGRLHSRTAEHDPRRPEPPRPAAGRGLTGGPARRPGRRRTARAVPAGGAAPGRRRARRRCRRPVGRPRRTPWTSARSLGRTVAPPPGGSPLLARAQRRAGTSSCSRCRWTG